MAKREKAKAGSTLTPMDTVLPGISDLADVISKALTVEFKDLGQVVFTIDDKEDPSSISDWISTGNTWLDINISNRLDGGIPVGRLTEITGLESSGKSLLASHILANTQKKGGLAIFIEIENSLEPNFLHSIGLDTSKDKFLHVNIDTVEDILAAIESIVVKAREKDPDRLITIVVDSIAAASTKTEIESDYDKAGYNTTKAIVLSQGMRKLMPMISKQRICLVFVNQLRHKMGLLMPGSDPYTTPGGKAVAFHASVRLRLKSIGKIKAKIEGVDQVVGIKTRAEVVKNKLGPAYRKADFSVYYDSGINNYECWFDLCKLYGIIEGVSSYRIINKATGEEEKFRSKDWYALLEKNNGEIKAQVLDQIAEKLVMKYKDSKDIDVDEVQLDTNDPVVD